jgi:hypothetical protein
LKLLIDYEGIEEGGVNIVLSDCDISELQRSHFTDKLIQRDGQRVEEGALIDSFDPSLIVMFEEVGTQVVGGWDIRRRGV